MFGLCAVVMAASLFLGGGTRGGFLSDAILQLIAIPLLLVALWRMFEAPVTRQARLALWFCLAVTLLPLIQLIPLPPRLWTALPNRQPSVEAFEIVGHAVPWMPISVSPHATWLSALSLLPPLAIFLSTLLLGYRDRRLLSLLILAVGIASVFVGLLQVAQGEGSPLRFFAITNPADAVGFFANRNHFAALLYCLMLFVVAWTLDGATASAPRKRYTRHQYDTTSIMLSMIGFTALVVLLAGEITARSRAGLVLTIAALFGAIALGVRNRGVGSRLTQSKFLFGAIALVVVFSLQFSLYRLLDRFSDSIQDDRPVIARTTTEAAKAYMPLGSGLGTFVPVYAMFEKPQDTSFSYVNHAHNDFLEVWLETGPLGLALIGLFAIWLVRRSVELWRSAPPNGASELDWSLARAATIVAALLVAHSLSDYPLRTGAMMAIMAFACALLIEPPVGAEYSDGRELYALSEKTRHRDRRRLEPATPALRGQASGAHHGAEPSDAPSISPDQRWGTNVKWPEEWSSSSKPRSSGAKHKPPNSPKPSR
jgi:O-antigen ligase